MDEQEKVKIIQALFDNLNARNFDASDSYFTDDYQGHAPNWEGPKTREQVKDTFRGQFKAFPDLSYELQDVIVQGDKAAATWEFVGTHQGELVTGSGQTVSATQRPVRLRASTFYDFKEGRIVRQESYLDTSGLLV